MSYDHYHPIYGRYHPEQLVEKYDIPSLADELLFLKSAAARSLQDENPAWTRTVERAILLLIFDS